MVSRQCTDLYMFILHNITYQCQALLFQLNLLLQVRDPQKSGYETYMPAYTLCFQALFHLASSDRTEKRLCPPQSLSQHNWQ